MINKYLISLSIAITIACSTFPVWGQDSTASEITFACEDSQGVPITVAKNKEGMTKTIFYWKEEVFKDEMLKSPAELCYLTTQRIAKLYAENNYKSAIRFVAKEEVELPVICLAGSSFECGKVILVIAPSQDKPSIEVAYEALQGIINSEITVDEKDICKYRCCHFLPLSSFKIDLMDLFSNDK